MAEKTIDQKIKQCKTVIIQNVEKSIQNTMIYRYFKDQKIDNDVKGYTLNTKDGLITMNFSDHEKARQYYDKANFKDKILIRPFNIYFNIQLNDSEMKKYYFQGINEDNMRKMFETARKIGICKIYTSYTSTGSSAKLKPTGVLSFVRKDPISDKQFDGLKEQLAAIGVKIYPYTPDKGLKCALVITNFYKGDLNEVEEIIEKNSRQQVSQLLNSIVKDKNVITNITPVVKRRQVPNADSKQGSKTETKIKVLVELGEYEEAIKNFEEIRIGFIELEAKATLNFYNAQNNSYICLFTTGLNKPENVSTKQFENTLVQVYRKINSNIVQVNIFPNGSNIYVGRVYLNSEEAGKDFIVDYDHHRDKLLPLYKSKDNIRFNINVDDKTQKKIKQFERRAGQITANIKNQGDRAKAFQNNKQHHNIPINQMGGIIPGMMPGMINPGKMPFPQGPIANQPGYPMMNPNPINMPPPNFPLGGMGGMGGPLGQVGGMMNPQMGMKLPVNETMRQKIEKWYMRKNQIVESSKGDPKYQQNNKKQCFQLVKYVLENDLKIPPIQSNNQANNILMNNDIGTVMEFMKKPTPDFYQKVLKL